MRTLYFNIVNGECVPQFTYLPTHRAIITGSKIHSIEACFDVGNIAKHGYEWFLEEVEKENLMWTKTHPHLMKSLKNLASEQSFRYLFKYSNFTPDNHRFPFVIVWMNNKIYSEAHFVDA